MDSVDSRFLIVWYTTGSVNSIGKANGLTPCLYNKHLFAKQRLISVSLVATIKKPYQLDEAISNCMSVWW